MSTALIGRMESHRQRLDQSPLQGGDVVRKLEAQRGFVGHILLENTVYRGSGKENHIGTEIITPGFAEFAVPTGFPRLKRHPVSYLQVLYIRADLYHHAAGFMSQHKGRLYHIVSNGTGLIVVHIAAADAYILQLDQHLICLGGGDGALGITHFSNALHNGHIHFSIHSSSSCLLLL